MMNEVWQKTRKDLQEVLQNTKKDVLFVAKFGSLSGYYITFGWILQKIGDNFINNNYQFYFEPRDIHDIAKLIILMGLGKLNYMAYSEISIAENEEKEEDQKLLLKK